MNEWFTCNIGVGFSQLKKTSSSAFKTNLKNSGFNKTHTENLLLFWSCHDSEVRLQDYYSVVLYPGSISLYFIVLSKTMKQGVFQKLERSANCRHKNGLIILQTTQISTNYESTKRLILWIFKNNNDTRLREEARNEGWQDLFGNPQLLPRGNQPWPLFDN